MSKEFIDEMSAGRGFGRIEARRAGDGAVWLSGVVATPHGFVTVYSQQGFSRFDFVWKGRLYMLNCPGRKFSERGLAMKAKRFAASIVEG